MKLDVTTIEDDSDDNSKYTSPGYDEKMATKEFNTIDTVNSAGITNGLKVKIFLHNMVMLHNYLQLCAVPRDEVIRKHTFRNVLSR